MANESAILARMRAARVPPNAFPHSLKALKQNSLAAVVAEKKFDTGVGGLISYLVKGARKAHTSSSLVCHVAAKELVLQGCKVFCTSIPEIVQPSDGDEAPDKLGIGYLVVADIGANTQYCTPFQWYSAQAYLLSHISRGGGLIIGVPDIDAVRFNAEFLDAMEIFENVAV
jgi:hypothetical protein